MSIASDERRTPKSRRLAAIVVVLLCAAPVPGDIGACGQEVARLDPQRFFQAKASIDCQHCTDCGIQSHACDEACTGSLRVKTFPDGCEPLVHDGEVCLRKLTVSACDDYARYLSDSAPTTPSECDFCPVEH